MYATNTMCTLGSQSFFNMLPIPRPIDGADKTQEFLAPIDLVPDFFPGPNFYREQSLGAMFIGQFASPLLHSHIGRPGCGENEGSERGLEFLRGFDLRLQFHSRNLSPQQPILLLALHTHPLPVLPAVNVHSGLRLPAAAIPIRPRVAPDLLPQVETQRLEVIRLVGRRETFRVGAHI